LPLLPWLKPATLELYWPLEPPCHYIENWKTNILDLKKTRKWQSRELLEKKSED
jgi:hypothetical protein